MAPTASSMTPDGLPGVVIEGAHVRLRRLERTDLPTFHRWANDRDVVAWARFSPDHMTSLAALEKSFEKELAGEETDRTTYIIEERTSGRAVGWCVVRTWDRKHVNADLGIALGEKDLWGKGYGTEAMELLLQIVFDHQGWHRAELGTLAENGRAIRSFEKCGFRKVGIEREAVFFNGEHHDVLLMEQLRSERTARMDRPAKPS